MRPSSRGRVQAVLVILLLMGVLGYAGYKAANYDAPKSTAVTQQSLSDRLKAEADKKQAETKERIKPTPPAKPEAQKPEATPVLPPAPAPPSTNTELVASGPAGMGVIVAAISLVSTLSAYVYQLKRLT